LPHQPGHIEEDLITDIVGNLVNQPTLPEGTSQAQTTIPQQVKPDELISSPGLVGTPVAGFTPAEAGQVAPVTTAPGTQQVDQAKTATPLVTATTVGQGAQLNLDDLDTRALASTQVAALTDFEPGNVPAFAQGAVREAEARLQARGLSRSTMAGEAVTGAILSAAIPIALQDAKVYENMQVQNLSNRQQALLSDQAYQNAASQMNAQSKLQVDQFFAGLAAQIGNSNANRLDAQEQFNVAEANRAAAINAQNQTEVELNNATLEATLSKYNADLESAREIFNVNNQLAIQQSNALWRRQLNTQNTAALNAAIQTDVMNLFNLSQFGLAAIWQQFRDEAAWVNQNSENALDRAHNLAVAAIAAQHDFDLQDNASQQALFEILGSFAFNLISG